jgi:hypothetical protein
MAAVSGGTVRLVGHVVAIDDGLVVLGHDGPAARFDLAA